MSVQDVCAKITPALQLNKQYSVEVDNLNDFIHILETYKTFLEIQKGIESIGQVTGEAYDAYTEAKNQLKYTPNTTDSPFKKGLLIYTKAYDNLKTAKLHETPEAKKVELYRDAYTTLDLLWQEFLGKLTTKQKNHFLNNIWPSLSAGSSLTRVQKALETTIVNINSKLPADLKETLQINAFWFTNPSFDKVPLALLRARNFAQSNCSKYFPKPAEPKKSDESKKPDEQKAPVEPKPSWFSQNVSFTLGGSAGYGDAIAGAKDDGLSFWGVLAQLKFLAVITPTLNTLLLFGYEGRVAYDSSGIYQDDKTGYKADYDLVANNANIGLAFSARFLEEILSFYAEARYSKHYQDISTDFMPGGQAVIANLGLSVSLYKKIVALQAIGTVQYEAVNFVKPFEDDKAYTQIRGTAAVGPTLLLGKSFTALNFIAGANQIIADPDEKLAVDENPRKNILGFSFYEQVNLDPVTLSLKAAYVNYDGENYFAAQPKAFVTINKYFGFGVFCPIQTVNEAVSLSCLLELRAGYPQTSSADSNQSLFDGPQTPFYIGNQLWQK